MRLIARFAKENDDAFEVITVYDEEIVKDFVSKEIPTLISISNEYPSAIWFERKIQDDFGISILYLEDQRPLVHHEHFPKNTFPMTKEFQETDIDYAPKEKHYSFVEHGVILGPTHPYHLESSQFQLLENDKTILHFEMFSFYKYRGIEKMLEGMYVDDAKEIVERIAATQTIAYQMALYDIELQASKKVLPEMLQKRHTFLLELERVINHVSDLSLLCQLVHFDDGVKLFSILLDEAREIMRTITGSRFGFSAIGRETKDFDLDTIEDYLYELEKTLVIFETWIEKRDKILLETLLLGQVPKRIAIEYGLVGIMARSTGITLDRREKDALFKKHGFHINLEEAGDTFSRFNIRITEIFTSVRLMKSLIDRQSFPFFTGNVTDGEYYSYIEGSAGELMMYVELKDAKIKRFFVRDPSFLNVQILNECLEGTKVASLDLVLQSIPLNISAIDL
jgi:Ni,Fe-hydrogenase III large subunit